MWANVNDALTKLAAFRDLTAERKVSEGEAMLREFLPAAWLTANPTRRLPLAR
jgi:hypothetical protein